MLLPRSWPGKRRGVLLLACVLALAPRTQAQQITRAQEQNLPAIRGHPQLKTIAAVLATSGAADVISPAARLTLLAPTDQAFARFFAEMGIGLGLLARDEPLADAIAAYHMLIGATLDSDTIFAVAARRRAKAGANATRRAAAAAAGPAAPLDRVTLTQRVYTAATPFYVTFGRGANATYVRDMQGNVAKVTGVLRAGRHIVHIIDRVLYSGEYFNTLGDLVAAYPSGLGSLGAALRDAGMGGLLTAKPFNDTLLAPNSKAFAAANLAAKGFTGRRLATLLADHIVPGRYTLPGGKTKPLTTLGGTAITVDGLKGPSGDFVLVDTTGQRAPITKADLFVSNGVVQVIGAVLMPKAAAAAAAKPAAPTPPAVKPAAAAAAAAKPAAAGGPAGRRRLMQPSTPSWATPTDLPNSQTLDGAGTATSAQDDADATIEGVARPKRAEPGTPGWANPSIGWGKSISWDAGDTNQGGDTEGQISGAVSARAARPSTPSWASPNIDLGKSISADTSGTNNQNAAEAQINAAAQQATRAQEEALMTAMQPIRGHPQLKTMAALLETSGAADAFARFFAEMGIGLGLLARDEPLADAIAAYHMLIGATLDSDTIFAVAARRRAKAGANATRRAAAAAAGPAAPLDRVTLTQRVYTAATPFYVTFGRGANATYVRGVQGHVAKVTGVLRAGRHIVHIIDRVLYSGEYFNTLGDLVAAYPSGLGSLGAALRDAGMGGLLTAKPFNDTLLAPNSKAFAAANLAAKGFTGRRLATLLADHIVPGRYTLPGGKTKPLTTLGGTAITVDGLKGPSGDFVLVDTTGQRAPITKADLFVSNGVVQVIGAVLMPKAAAAAAATPAAPAGAAKPAAPAAAAAKPAAPTAAAVKPTAAAAAAAKPAAAGGPAGRRRLMQPSTPSWATPTDLPNLQTPDDMGGAATAAEDDADATIEGVESPKRADPATPGWADPSIDWGKAISWDTDDTSQGETAEAQIAGAVSSSASDPSTPSWATPSIDLGKSISETTSDTKEEDAAEAQIDNSARIRACPPARRPCAASAGRRRASPAPARPARSGGPRMPKIQPPELKKFMDKKLSIVLNANRHVTGTLRGFDQFMNIVLDQTVDMKAKQDIGMVVIRGNSIITIEALEPIY
ncbi:small nuclear ribonucleoprotein G [Scenedesmus sp. PABB004]|nr:small nuclear ribonucleoprotein G [Scenedesmus sp. PABB004]